MNEEYAELENDAQTSFWNELRCWTIKRPPSNRLYIDNAPSSSVANTCRMMQIIGNEMPILTVRYYLAVVPSSLKHVTNKVVKEFPEAVLGTDVLYHRISDLQAASKHLEEILD